MSTELNRRFNQLVHEHSHELLRFAYWLSKSHALAQDIVQEAWVRAWRSMADLRDQTVVKSWLLTIVRREYLRTLERKQLDTVDLDTAIETESKQPGLDQQSESEQIRQAMLKLEPKYRVPLVLQVLAGMSCQEIASELGIGEPAVMTQLFRARQKLKLLLENKPNRTDAEPSDSLLTLGAKR